MNHRSIGLNHQNGKGDKDRTADVESFRRNFEAVVFPPARGFTKTSRGLRKVYGAPAKEWRAWENTDAGFGNRCAGI